MARRKETFAQAARRLKAEREAQRIDALNKEHDSVMALRIWLDKRHPHAPGVKVAVLDAVRALVRKR